MDKDKPIETRTKYMLVIVNHIKPYIKLISVSLLVYFSRSINTGSISVEHQCALSLILHYHRNRLAETTYATLSPNRK